VREFPAGIVTFLLTDVEGSTAAWERDPEMMAKAIADLDDVVGTAVGAGGGVLVKSRGEGDSHFCVFERPVDAVAVALALMQSLAEGPLRIRVGIHTGEVELRDGDYYGRTVNRAARLRSAGNGGQVILSDVTAGLVKEALPSEASLKDLGTHRLKDLAEAETIWQLAHSAVPVTETPLHTLDLVRNNLPLQLTEVIGREDAVAEVQVLMATRRLVTLVGLGGSGKTRLGLQVAAESAERFAGGAWFVEVAPLSESSAVAPAVVSAIGGQPGADPLVMAADWIGSRAVLLVLDNCETQIDGCAEVARELLKRCPNLVVVATSRQPLDVSGEAVYRVPPLGLPEPGVSVDPARLSGFAAVQLFVDRGRLVDPEFSVTTSNADSVAALCVGLGGMPLALELAAARLRVLTPDQILARLADRLGALEGPGRGEGHRSVRGAIEWSHDLLKPREQVLFRRLALFEAPAGLDAVEEICSDWVTDPVDDLSNLVDLSLVTAERVGTGMRYRLQALVRDFGLERLDAADERDVSERARADWARGLYDNLRQCDFQESALRDEVRSSRPDVVAALTWLESGDAPGFVELAKWAVAIWNALGWWSLAVTWARRLMADSLMSDRWRAYLTRTIGEMMVCQEKNEEALAIGEECLRMAREMGDPLEEEFAHNMVGGSHWQLRNLPPARHHLEQALELARRREDGFQNAALYAQNLGLVSGSEGAFDQAADWFRTSVDLSRDTWQRVLGLRNLASLAKNRGDHSSASALYSECVDISRLHGNPAAESDALARLGHIAELEGDWQAAGVHRIAARDVAAQSGDPSSLARRTIELARHKSALGLRDEADDLLEAGLEVLADYPEQRLVVLRSQAKAVTDAREADMARRLARLFLESAERDAGAKEIAYARLLLAEREAGAGNRPEAERLARTAQAELRAFAGAFISGRPATDLVTRCEKVLAEIGGSGSVERAK